jgi:hypothetical protein
MIFQCHFICFICAKVASQVYMVFVVILLSLYCGCKGEACAYGIDVCACISMCRFVCPYCVIG